MDIVRGILKKKPKKHEEKNFSPWQQLVADLCRHLIQATCLDQENAQAALEETLLLLMVNVKSGKLFQLVHESLRLREEKDLELDEWLDPVVRVGRTSRTITVPLPSVEESIPTPFSENITASTRRSTFTGIFNLRPKKRQSDLTLALVEGDAESGFAHQKSVDAIEQLMQQSSAQRLESKDEGIAKVNKITKSDQNHEYANVRLPSVGEKTSNPFAENITASTRRSTFTGLFNNLRLKSPSRKNSLEDDANIAHRVSVDGCSSSLHQSSSQRLESMNPGVAQVGKIQKLKDWRLQNSSEAGTSFTECLVTMREAFGIADAAKEPENYPDATVLHLGIHGFSTWCNNAASPSTVTDCLTSYFSLLDCLTEQFDVKRVDTVSDSYMVVCGARFGEHDHAVKMAHFALEVLKTQEILRNDIFNNDQLFLRMGIHCGPVVCVGAHGDYKRQELLGETVQIARLIERTSLPGHIQISQDMRCALDQSFLPFDTVPHAKLQMESRDGLGTYLLLDFMKRQSSTPTDGSHVSPGASPRILNVRRNKQKSISDGNIRVRQMISDRSSVSAGTSPTHSANNEELNETSTSGYRLRNYSANAVLRCPSRRGSSDSAASSRLPQTPNSNLVNQVYNRLRSEGRARLSHSGPVAEELTEAEHANQGKLELLLAHDQASELTSYTELLEVLGLDIITARNGQEALDLMKQNLYVVVFILNMGMPEMSGSECVNKLRQWEHANRLQKQYICALTDKNLTKVQESQLYRYGINHLIPKVRGQEQQDALLDLVSTQLVPFANKMLVEAEG